ncbi:ABC transporter permease [Terribacillus aidingensis]|uniref:YhgE/Pip domain-containing protein n=1 Tax=Terribacillus aidingensis TaxID=586416 RepID=UPI00344BECF3
MKGYLKEKTTWIGIATALAFLMIFLCVWLTAYHDVEDRIGNLRIGIVVQDEQFETGHVEKLKEAIPFRMEQFSEVDEAKKELEGHNLDMVMIIPSHFIQDSMAQGAEVRYIINQAAPSMSKQAMESAANNITDKMDEQLLSQRNTGLNPDDVESLRKKSDSIHAVQPIIEKIHETKAFAASMIPLLITLASFVGSMLLSLNLYSSASKLREHYPAWRIFLSRFILQALLSIVFAVVTICSISGFGFVIHGSLFLVIIFQGLVYFTFMNTSMMFLVIFGPAGMIFNILVLSVQLVTAGIIVPRELLSDFYKELGSYLPATYGTEGYFSIIYGGLGLQREINMLLLILSVTLLIMILKLGVEIIRKSKKA